MAAPMKAVNKNIAYGGILSNYVINLPSNDTDIQLAAEFAVSYGSGRFPHAFPMKDGRMKEYTITKMNKLKLGVTLDGKTAWLVGLPNPLGTEPDVIPLMWGVTTAFRVAWPDVPNSFTHQFIVTEYWDQGFYIYQHTFFKTSAQGTHSEEKLNFDLEPPLAKIVALGEGNSVVDLDGKVVEREGVHYGKGSEQGHCVGGSEGGHCVKETCEDESNCLQEDIMGEVPENGAAKYLQPESNENRECEQEGKCNSQTDQSEGEDLRVLCYNIWNTNTVQEDKTGRLYWKRIKQMVTLIQSSGAPVVAFQEVRFEDGKGGRRGPNQVQHLADLLTDYQFVFRPAQVQQHGLPRRIEEGLAIFSRYPILAAKHVLLSRDPRDPSDGHQRILLHAEIQLPKTMTRVHVLTTHLSLSHIARQRTVRQIWRYVTKLSGPVLVMGDFNAEAHNDEVRFLGGKVELGGVTTEGYIDVWETLHPKDKGFTFSTLEEKLTKRIDLMFMKEDDHIKPVDIKLLDDQKRGEEAASDHIGLLGTFHIKKMAKM